MKRLGNKGQGAMEYLMTYGWAILVVMIVGVVLWQLGIFKIGQTTTTFTGFSKLQPLSQTIVYSKGTGPGAQNFTASFMNTIGTSIRIDQVTLIEVITSTTCVLDGTTTVGTTVGAGDTLKLNYLCTGANKNQGDTYDMSVVVKYSAVTGATATAHTESGDIKGPVEA